MAICISIKVIDKIKKYRYIELNQERSYGDSGWTLIFDKGWNRWERREDQIIDEKYGWMEETHQEPDNRTPKRA